MHPLHIRNITAPLGQNTVSSIFNTAIYPFQSTNMIWDDIASLLIRRMALQCYDMDLLFWVITPEWVITLWLKFTDIEIQSVTLVVKEKDASKTF